MTGLGRRPSREEKYQPALGGHRMRTSRHVLGGIATGLAVAFALPAPAGQDAAKAPVIGARTYVGGSATVTVSGSFQLKANIPINQQASLSDGEMTWLQYGASGSEAGDVLVTVSLDEIGVTVGRGKKTATAGAVDCTGKIDVTASLVTGHYTCPGVTSHDPREMGLGKVNIEVRFTAMS
jgi:hypothetical protein